MSNYPAPGQYNYPSQEAPSLNKPQNNSYAAPGQYNYPPQQQQGYPPQQQGYGGYPPQQPYTPQGLPPQQYAAPYGGGSAYATPPPVAMAPPTSYPGYNSGAYSSYQQTSVYGMTYPSASPYPSYGVSAPIVSTSVVTPVVTPAAVVAPVMGVADVPYVLHLRGCRLDRKDLFSKSDPFLTISVPRTAYANKGSEGYVDTHGGGSSSDWIVIHRTETHHDNQNPTFSPITLSLYTLTGGNMERPIKIECWDYDSHNHDFIGSSVSTLREMAIMKELRLVNKKRIGLSSTAGSIEILRCGPA